MYTSHLRPSHIHRRLRDRNISTGRRHRRHRKSPAESPTLNYPSLSRISHRCRPATRRLTLCKSRYSTAPLHHCPDGNRRSRRRAPGSSLSQRPRSPTRSFQSRSPPFDRLRKHRCCQVRLRRCGPAIESVAIRLPLASRGNGRIRLSRSTATGHTQANGPGAMMQIPMARGTKVHPPPRPVRPTARPRPLPAFRTLSRLERPALANCATRPPRCRPHLLLRRRTHQRHRLLRPRAGAATAAATAEPAAAAAAIVKVTAEAQ